MNLLPRVVVAGTASGVGKTTVAMGLMAALAARGTRVAGAKVGPDFIDPSYHALATGRPPRNLDPFLSGEDLVAPLFAHGAAGAEIAVIEGVMGLFDGASGTRGFASTAHVATLLDAPVLLVVDAGGMARSIAALVHGYATFDPAVRIAGVVANRVGSPRHTALLREALAPLGVPLVGSLPRTDALAAPSRHLGLVPAAERDPQARATVTAAGDMVAAHLDLEAVTALARSAPAVTAAPWAPPEPTAPAARPRVAVAGGPAFTFTYTEHVELLAAAGADVVTVDPLDDAALPPGTAALVIGGGFPEVHAAALSANAPLRAAVAAHAAAGRPLLAECGGMLYLCRRLDGHPQCGVLPADAALRGRLHLGYRSATVATPTPWWPEGAQVHAHEFHHALVTPAAGAAPAWRMADRTEGFVTAGVHASWLHTHWTATPEVPVRVVAAARAAATGGSGVAACA